MSDPISRHRLAAILCADAVGYSRLMAADERATVAALEAARAAFRRQIEANQGRVIDMAGDSVLAVFESAAGAVTAALAVQSELEAAAHAVAEDRRMRFRIGVHLGDVIEKADGAVYGDGVNIAARLQAGAEPGCIWISDAVRGAVKSRVAAAFDDLGEQQMKNLAEPVRAFCVRTVTEAAAKPAPSLTEIDLSLPDKPSIAVLPFANMSGDPEQEYFTDGVTEDIITELSRFHSLFVIARNSSFTYKGKAVDVRTVGKELGVRYVLEGSIRRSANQIRVTAQLIDALSGKHIWAEKYDRVLEDIFAVQEEVTECIVGAIAPQIDAAEMLRARRRPGSLSAYEIAVRANALAWDGFQKSDLAARNEALRLARAAREMDPDSGLALSVVGFVQWQHLIFATAEDRDAAWKEGMDAVMRGMESSESSFCHGIRAFLLVFAPSGSRWEEARIAAEAAYQSNTQDARIMRGAGFILAGAGYPVDGVRILERSLRLNPRDPYAFLTYSNLAQAHFFLNEYRKGLGWALRATDAAPSFAPAYAEMAVLYVGLGDMERAKTALETALRIAPGTFSSRRENKQEDSSRQSNRGATMRARRYKFLRIAAGLEDPSAADALR